MLDVGCGTGSVAFELRRRYPDRSVWAVDVSAAYLAFARGREGGASIRFEQADAPDLPFDAGRFSASIAQLALNFMPDPRRAAQEMRRVTRSGGVVAAAVWDFRGGLVFQRLFWDTAAAIDPQAAVARDRLFSHPLAQPEGLARLWQEIGLRDIDSGSLTIRMDYASFDDYWEPLLGGQGPFGAYVAGLPDGRPPSSARPSVMRIFPARRTARVRSPLPPGPCADMCRRACPGRSRRCHCPPGQAKRVPARCSSSAGRAGSPNQ